MHAMSFKISFLMVRSPRTLGVFGAMAPVCVSVKWEKKIYHDMLNMYRAASQLINDAVASDGK
jgi:hypothetical protein